ncbi:Zinc finger CCCH domain-containing protein 11 [Morus notabilis]|uniref:Zinc finger CCCH domain-containing protein 11 n=1 Tax=Morus notabilis TaxID=981085 RepID=W9RFQ8_9ROSA|nr:Zinc finger CCCH domain-containing protein 11 [Morus notabilis]
MPPKQQSKVDLAKKQKIVEDKTFGLKNKNKSKNVQKYVQNLKQSVQPKPDTTKINAKKKKEEEKAKEKELNDLFKVAVSQPKVPVGVDPKSILCEFFKVGQCAKGFKCKFSHDLNVQRKGEKIDIYSDKRDQETMEDWDQETLEKVVESKKTEYNPNKPTEIVCRRASPEMPNFLLLSPISNVFSLLTLIGQLLSVHSLRQRSEYSTTRRKNGKGRKYSAKPLERYKAVAFVIKLQNLICGSAKTRRSDLEPFKKSQEREESVSQKVCKYFLEAVEKKQYGWFWVCPNGGKDCHYRHALPPGYVLKSQMKALLEEETEKITIEEEIENQRAKVKTTTPMTPDLFFQWKKKKIEERDAGLAAQQAERAKNDRMSGRELFLSDASLFVDDVEAYEKYTRQEPQHAEEKVSGSMAAGGPSTSSGAAADSEEVSDVDDDEDELDMDELNELEASLSKTSIQIREPGIEAS